MIWCIRELVLTDKTSPDRGEFLLDSSSVVRWVDLTEDFRVRARPEQIIEAAKALR
jgi:hypothetical protein